MITLIITVMMLKILTVMRRMMTILSPPKHKRMMMMIMMMMRKMMTILSPPQCKMETRGASSVLSVQCRRASGPAGPGHQDDVDDDDGDG